MNTSFLSATAYKFLFGLLGIVYIIGLFVPLMDNDSAHHANIALHMHLTGDYVSLIDYGHDYLDKPHLHFWLAAFSYKIFGVTTFAYKIPSFLFTILGTYSTYRLGKTLYNAETGRLAALITASAFAYMLANNDVRMDAILTASIVFAIWQLVELVQTKKLLSVVLSALGLALGFSVKGHIGIIIPGVAILFYLAYLRRWKILLSWQWWLMAVLFFVFISPVVYCYYLQYNLHPEKIVRGKDHINGVKFILFEQSVERFQGDSFGADNKKDYLFFLHSFLWAFAPWSILAYAAIAGRLKTFGQRKQEWLTVGSFVVMLLIVSFSGFKLPHYLNVIFPGTSILLAAWLLEQQEKPRRIKNIFVTQVVVVMILLLLLVVINAWAFPVKGWALTIGVVAFLTVVFYYIITPQFEKLQKAVCVSVAAMALVFFCLNSNFYPRLLQYQAGNELAFGTKNAINPAQVYSWENTYSSSYNFYTATLHQPFTDTVLQSGEPVWLLYDVRSEQDIQNRGYRIGKKYSALSYRVTRLSLPFLNPLKREGECSTMIIGELKK